MPRNNPASAVLLLAPIPPPRHTNDVTRSVLNGGSAAAAVRPLQPCATSNSLRVASIWICADDASCATSRIWIAIRSNFEAIAPAGHGWLRARVARIRPSFASYDERAHVPRRCGSLDVVWNSDARLLFDIRFVDGRSFRSTALSHWLRVETSAVSAPRGGRAFEFEAIRTVVSIRLAPGRCGSSMASFNLTPTPAVLFAVILCGACAAHSVVTASRGALDYAHRLGYNCAGRFMVSAADRTLIAVSIVYMRWKTS